MPPRGFRKKEGRKGGREGGRKEGRKEGREEERKRGRREGGREENVSSVKHLRILCHGLNVTEKR